MSVTKNRFVGYRDEEFSILVMKVANEACAPRREIAGLMVGNKPSALVDVRIHRLANRNLSGRHNRDFNSELGVE